MPERATIDQILEKLAILAAIRRGEEAADQGKVISHAAMKKRARSWNTK
jgi:predicted transcriptional regulator